MDLDNIKDDELLLGDATEEFAPPSVMVSAPVMDIGFHPQLPIFAVGLVTGEIEIYEYKGCDIAKKPLVNDFSSWVFGRERVYSSEDVVISHHSGNMRMHPTGSVSAMEFTDDGSYLVTASGDRTISVLDCVSARLVIHLSADQVVQKTASAKKLNKMNKKNHGGTTAVDPLEGGTAGEATAGKGMGGDRVRVLTSLKAKTPAKRAKTYAVTPNPHKFGISALNVCDDNLIATGDDDGLVAIWDMRDRKPAHTYHEHGDYVSQLCYFTDVQELVSSSGDTCLGCYDVRAGRIRDFSEPRKDEISCFAFINSTATNNASFIPSIMCGTPSGSLPIWKYGSWRRPYDVMEYHPRECETIISFHGEDTTFNHNIVLTGACDGLVRVVQMYPVRRNICQISARDYTYSHQNSSHRTGTSTGNFVVRRGRGHEAISKMRVSHDSSLLAVSGSDSIIDFVDIRFLSDQEQLSQLRGKAERRHMDTLRRMEVEATKAAAEAEQDDGGVTAEAFEKVRAEEMPPAGRREARAPHAAPETTVADAGPNSSSHQPNHHQDNSSSSSESDADGDQAKRLKEEEDADSSGSEPTEEDRRKSMAMKERLIALLKERARAKKREREEREEREALRAANASSSDEDGNGPIGGGGAGQSDSDFDSSDDADMFSSDDEALLARKRSALRARRGKAEKGVVGGEDSASSARERRPKKNDPASKKPAVGGKGSDTATPTSTTTTTVTTEAAPSHEDQATAAMEAYQATRQEKRARVAAAKWLKEEKKKKINFTYEKRRRRVGGFFGDMVNPD